MNSASPIQVQDSKQAVLKAITGSSCNIAENSQKGFIFLYRSIRKHWLWKDANKFQWWIDILLEVNHKPGKVNIGFELIDCDRGQSLHSLREWSLRWRVDISTVRRFLKLLENDGMIVTENIKKTTRLTVCNYDSYNSLQQAKQTQNNHETNATQTQRNTNKNEKKEKNEKVVDSISFFSDSRRNHLYQLFQQGSNWEHEFVIEQIGFFENKYCNVPINQCGVLVNGWIKNYKPAHEGRTTQDINATPSNWI